MMIRRAFMTREETIVVFFRLVSAHDLSVTDMLTETAEFYFPKTQPLLGKESIRKFFGILARQYPRLVFDLQRIIVQGDHAAVHWKNRGVNRKKEPYENEGVTFMEFKDEKISFLSDFFKDTGRF
jgi:ketosteroid isomerase-like protein